MESTKRVLRHSTVSVPKGWRNLLSDVCDESPRLQNLDEEFSLRKHRAIPVVFSEPGNTTPRDEQDWRKATTYSPLLTGREMYTPPKT